jgi:hypothetical protein
LGFDTFGFASSSGGLLDCCDRSLRVTIHDGRASGSTKVCWHARSACHDCDGQHCSRYVVADGRADGSADAAFRA